MSPQGRPRRVAELIRQEIASLITRGGVKDPRIGFVSVMDVRMSPDVKYADIYVSLFGDEAARKSSLIGLQRASGWMRRELGKVIRLRYTPELRFHEDGTLDQVYHLEEVFKEIHDKEAQNPMLRLDLEGVVAELRQVKSALITSHVNPDGDAIGSLLGMRLLLQALGCPEVHCALEDPAPRVYRFLPGADGILGPGGAVPEFDTVIMLDCAVRSRTGAIAAWFEKHPRTLIIDHHQEEHPEGWAGLVDPGYAATGEIIAELFEAAGVPMTKEAAECLYCAQSTDTGVFRFSNTTARSHLIAARLLETGIDASGIAHRVYEVMSRAKFELLRLVLDRMEIAADGRLAHTWVTAADLESFGARKEDLDGLVNYARNIEGVTVAILFNEVDAGRTKVSFRSNPEFNSATFLNRFGGGGHAAAAGASIDEALETARPMVTAAVLEALGVAE